MRRSEPQSTLESVSQIHLNLPPHMEFFAVLLALFGIVTTILWIIIGWRAMRAHERIADAATEWSLQQRSERLASRQQSQPHRDMRHSAPNPWGAKPDHAADESAPGHRQS